MTQPTTTTTTTSPTDVGSKIVEEHRKLKALMARLKQEDGLDGVIATLDAIRDLLVVHFEREESDDGLVKIVSSAGPVHVHKLRELMGEHEEILRAIDVLAARAERCRTETADVHRATATLLAMLRSHEARENDMIADALYTDYGGDG